MTSFNSLSRPMGLLTISGIILGLLSPGAFSVHAAPVKAVAGDVNINEIMQNPSAVSDDNGEWFELYNATASDIDINGWTIMDNDYDSHLINNGGPLSIPAGGYLVLGNNADSATNGGVAVDYVFPSDWYLGNSGDEVILIDDSLNEIDRVEYDGGPEFPDPNGVSMSLLDASLDNNVGANWCESTTPYGDGDMGTPGAANDCAPPPPTPLVINEIMQNPSEVNDSEGEWFEIFNPSGSDVDVNGWTIRDNNGELHVIDNGGPLVVAVGGFLVFGNNADTGTNGGVVVDYAYDDDWFLSNSADEIVLLDDSLVEVDRVEYDGGLEFPDPSGASMSLRESSLDNNIGTNWCEATTPYGDGDLGTPGSINVCATHASIYEIQNTTDPGGDSPYKDQAVITQGVVTAFFYAGDDRLTFIQDGTGPWSGLLLYRPEGFVNVGDLLQVEGEVSEYYGMTEIVYGKVTVLSSGNPLPSPEVLPSGEVSREMWESVLARVENATVVDDDLGHGEWSVNDSSGAVRIDDLGSYSYMPANGDFLDFVQGPLNYSYDDFKIEPRDDDDLGIAPPFLPICEIQGTGFTSPYEGQTVRTEGIVVADFDQTGKDGFFIQDENCDGDPATSDGIFVYIYNSSQVVSSGDLVALRGYVSEYYNLTEISADIEDIVILSEENSLPVPVDLNPPFDNTASRVYFESLEGMHVSLNDAAVVGPTNYYDETYVLRSDLGLDRIFQDHPAGTGVIVGVDDGGLFEIEPEVKVGNRVTGLLGALDFTFGYYKMQLTAPPLVYPSSDPEKVGDVDGDGDIDMDDLRMISKYWGRSVPPAPASADLDGDGRITYMDVLIFLRLYRKYVPRWNDFTVATFNLENLFDTVNEPGKSDPVRSLDDYELKLDKLAEAIHDDLREPTIIGVQEAENLTVLTDLAARPEIGVHYEALLVDGPDARGIDVGLLYQVDRVKILEYESRQGCTSMVDGLGPDGNRDVYDPSNAITCDTDGDGVLDGNRLFSRPPLVVHLEFGMELPRRGWSGMGDVWVIVNHFKSKSEDTEELQYTLPRRLEQAAFVADLVQEIQASDWSANVIALGDLNDFLDSEPLARLMDVGLIDLLYETPKPNRYTYIYQGESEVLDHVLISDSLRSNFQSIEPVHINADYPNFFAELPDLSRRSSDHDAVVVKFWMRYWWGW